MEPRIGQSLIEGFRAASRSWAAIGVLIGCWIAVFLIAVICLVLTNPPAELFQERPPTAAISAAPAGGSPQVREAPKAGTDLFTQLAQTPTEPVSPDAAAPAAAAAPQPEGPAADPAAAQARRVVTQWFRRAWPMLLVCFLLVMAANLWLTGAQIGYLAKRMSGGPAPLSEFWRSGTRAFGALLGATLIFGLVLVVLALALGLISWLFALLGPVAPKALVGVLSVIVGLGMLMGFVWVLVRAVSFWFIAVVVDQLDPMAGLKAGLRVTRRRFWRVLGLGLLVLLISYGVWLPFGVLEWISTQFGGGLGEAGRLLSNLLGGLASVFVGFAVSAAFIRFYQGARAGSPATGSSG